MINRHLNLVSVEVDVTLAHCMKIITDGSSPGIWKFRKVALAALLRIG